MSISTGALEWIRPKAWKLDWELRRGAEVVARMASPSLFGTSIRATLGGEEFVLRKGGLRRPGATIASPGEATDLAQLEFDALDRGTVVLPDGATYLWERTEPAGTWKMSREDGTVLFTIHRDVRSKYPTGKVEVRAEDKHNGLLLVLTWFMISTIDC